MKKIEKLIDAFNEDVQLGFVIGVAATCFIFAVASYAD